MKLVLIVLANCLLCFLVLHQGVKCQGFVKVALTDHGLDYAAIQAVEILSEQILNSKIDDKTGTANTGFGNVDYEITDVAITRFVKPSSDVTVNSGQGLTLSLTGASVSISGRWKYSYKWGILNSRDNGRFEASVENAGMEVSVSLTKNDVGGSPRIQSTGCTASIDRVGFTLHGGATWLKTIFENLYTSPVRTALGLLMCSKINKAIDTNGANQLATLNLHAKINDVLTLDYGLASDPVFGHNVMETSHVGIFLNDDTSEQASNFSIATGGRMFAVSISELTLNSGLCVLHSNNLLKTSTEFQTDLISEILSNITNVNDALVAGSSLSVEIKAIETPTAYILPGVVGIKAKIEGIFDVVQTNGSRNNVLTLGLSIACKVNVFLEREELKGSVLEFSHNVTSNSLADVSLEKMNNAVEIVKRNLLPSVNEFLATGMPLPDVEKVRFLDGIITLNAGYVTVAANVDYQP